VTRTRGHADIRRVARVTISGGKDGPPFGTAKIRFAIRRILRFIASVNGLESALCTLRLPSASDGGSPALEHWQPEATQTTLSVPINAVSRYRIGFSWSVMTSRFSNLEESWHLPRYPS